MNKVIWKFDIDVDDFQEISMPLNAEILCVQSQFGKPKIWAIVNPDAIKIKRVFWLAGTGHDLPEVTCKRKYIGTFQMLGGMLVYHLFEVIN